MLVGVKTEVSYPIMFLSLKKTFKISSANPHPQHILFPFSFSVSFWKSLYQWETMPLEQFFNYNLYFGLDTKVDVLGWGNSNFAQSLPSNRSLLLPASFGFRPMQQNMVCKLPVFFSLWYIHPKEDFKRFSAIIIILTTFKTSPIFFCQRFITVLMNKCKYLMKEKKRNLTFILQMFSLGPFHKEWTLWVHKTYSWWGG